MRNAPVVSGTSTPAASMEARTRFISPRGSCVIRNRCYSVAGKWRAGNTAVGLTETLQCSPSCQRTFNASGGCVSSLYMQNTTPAEGTSVQRCLRCARALAELAPRPQCPYCGGLLELRHGLPAERGAALVASFRASPSPSGVWRFGALVLPSAADAPITWPEGNTPLIARRKIAEWAGVPGLQLKHEGMNPTGSFKDRGMTVGVTQAVRVGATAVACASTGNTGASLAAYAALAGLPALVLVPT